MQGIYISDLASSESHGESHGRGQMLIFIYFIMLFSAIGNEGMQFTKHQKRAQQAFYCRLPFPGNTRWCEVPLLKAQSIIINTNILRRKSIVQQVVSMILSFEILFHRTFTKYFKKAKITKPTFQITNLVIQTSLEQSKLGKGVKTCHPSSQMVDWCLNMRSTTPKAAENKINQ